MEWHYSHGGKPAGPVTGEQLAELARQGTIQKETLVWREGMPGWRPYHEALATPPPLKLPDGQALCSECRRAFSTGEMIQFQKHWVCAACKPVFLQKLQEGAPLGTGGVWRMKKKTLVMSRTAQLPDRCVKCNVAAPGQRLHRKLYWHHPALYVLIFLGVLLYAIVALCVRKRASIDVGLCAIHQSQRRQLIALGWLLALGGVALMILGGVNDLGWVAFSGIPVFIAGAVLGIVKGRVVTAHRIDAGHIWLRGVNREYLDSLPEWPGKL